MNQEYWLEISRFKRNASNINYEKLLSRQPWSLQELGVWCELMLIAKIEQEDVPDNGVFYLHDRAYEEVTATLEEVSKNRISFKLELLGHVLGMSGSANIGIVRELEFLGPASFTLLTERRRHAPWGLAGGGPGAMGENRLNNRPLPPKYEGQAQRGDRLRIASPGGGGYGANE